jgi:hypothetical protein
VITNISVIIPLYNHVDYIEAALASVVDQISPTDEMESIRMSGVLCRLGLSGLCRIVVGEAGMPLLEQRSESAI